MRAVIKSFTRMIAGSRVRRGRAALTLAAALALGATWPALGLISSPALLPVDPPPGPGPDEDPPPHPVPPSPVVGDYDLDGLVDTYEDQLLARFAPRVWLHDDESRLPVNVDWLLARSTLRYSHSRCSDDQIIAQGAVTRSNVITQSHRNKHDPLESWPWEYCEHYGSYHSSNSYQGGQKDTFFLQYTDAAHDGISSTGSWQVYGHVYPSVSNRVVVQYWQLYGYNDSFATANHEGDWEYSAVLLSATGTPLKVIYYRHGRAVVYNPGEVSWIGEHHVSYSAKGSHGQYPGYIPLLGHCQGDGVLDSAQGFSDPCNQGFAWDTWAPGFGAIVNVGERYHPLNNSNWIQYSGLWGEIGASADFISFTSGPRGPPYQDTWLSSY